MSSHTLDHLDGRREEVKSVLLVVTFISMVLGTYSVMFLGLTNDGSLHEGSTPAIFIGILLWGVGIGSTIFHKYIEWEERKIENLDSGSEEGPYQLKVVHRRSGIVQVEAESEAEARQKAKELAKGDESQPDFNEDWSTNSIRQVGDSS